MTPQYGDLYEWSRRGITIRVMYLKPANTGVPTDAYTLVLASGHFGWEVGRITLTELPVWKRIEED